jgi:hypothetical protein
MNEAHISPSEGYVDKLVTETLFLKSNIHFPRDRLRDLQTMRRVWKVPRLFLGLALHTGTVVDSGWRKLERGDGR